MREELPEGFPKIEDPTERLYAATREIKKTMETMKKLDDNQKQMTATIRDKKKHLKRQMKLLTAIQFKTTDEIYSGIQLNGKMHTTLYDYEAKK